MLTQRHLDDIKMRHERIHDVLADNGRPDRGFITASARDVPILLADIERLIQDLADCWLVLDGIARAEQVLDWKAAATVLLWRQKAPGWKEAPHA